MLKQIDSVIIANKVLNYSLKKKFGSDFSLRIDSMVYKKNRDYRNGFRQSYNDKIYVVVPNNIPMKLLKEIEEFLLNKLNDFSMCFDYNNYKEIPGIRMVIRVRS